MSWTPSAYSAPNGSVWDRLVAKIEAGESLDRELHDLRHEHAVGAAMRERGIALALEIERRKAERDASGAQAR